MSARASVRAALLGGCAAALIALPLTSGPGPLSVQAKAAAARDKGGGDHGRGGGQGQGRGEQGGAGAGRSHGAAAEARSRGPERDRERGPALASAQARYQDALGRKRSVDRGAAAAGGRHEAVPAAMLNRRQTGALIAQGWQSPAPANFRNHGQRVRTMVALAKELGYPASVGALQGNFGTPFENGAATVMVELEVARAALALAPLDPLLQGEVVRLETSLATATAGLPHGSLAGWATIDLDVTNDSVVDAADLAATQAASEGATVAAAP